MRDRIKHVLIQGQQVVIRENEPQILETLGQPPAPLHVGVAQLRLWPPPRLEQPGVAVLAHPAGGGGASKPPRGVIIARQDGHGRGGRGALASPMEGRLVPRG